MLGSGWGEKSKKKNLTPMCQCVQEVDSEGTKKIYNIIVSILISRLEGKLKLFLLDGHLQPYNIGTCITPDDSKMARITLGKSILVSSS